MRVIRHRVMTRRLWMTKPPTCAAILRAEILSRIQGNVGAIAFSRTGDPDVGKFEDAMVLKRFGDVPSGMTMLF
jgi:hypothetical protein